MSIDLVAVFGVVVMVCAAIYLLAAASGRPVVAWIGFAASVPFVGAGLAVGDERISLIAIGLAQVVLVVVGAIRHRWRDPANLWQLAAAVGFSALAVVAVVMDAALVAGVLVIAGLLAHAVWDVWHHRKNRIVPRPYATFCAVLDAVLAVAIVVVLAIGGA